MKKFICLTIFAFVFLSLARPAARAATSDVYKLVANLSGYIQGGATNEPAIEPVLINSDNLVHLGLGVPLQDPVNPNAVLAFTSDCATNTTEVIVYDNLNGTRLATIGVVNPQLSVEGYLKHKFTKQVIADLIILPTGDGTNGLTGGRLNLAGAIDATTNGCLKSLKSNVQGVLGTSFYTIFTNFVCTNVISCNQNMTKCTTNCDIIATNITVGVSNIEVAVTRSGFNTGGKKLGTLIENP